MAIAETYEEFVDKFKPKRKIGRASCRERVLLAV